MQLERLYIEDYERLYVSGIKKIEYTPKKKIQVILGTNGSGKSSLLKEIIPNVDNLKDDYGENGKKELEISHRGNKYVIRFDRKTNKHSFIKNNEELNTAGQLKIQKSLIDNEFKITKEVMEVLLSTNSFTVMTVNERKKWFTKILSHIDYEYAMSVFNRAKDRYKELQSFMKLTRSKILKDEEMFKTKGEDFQIALKNEINRLNSLIEKLLESKEPYKEVDTKKYLTKIDEISSKLYRDIYKLENLIKDRKINIENLESRITEVKSRLEYLKHTKEDLTTRIEKIENMNIDETDNPEDLRKRLNILNNEIDEIINLFPFRVSIKEIEQFNANFLDSYNNLLETVTLLNDERYRNLKLKDYKSYKERYEKIKTELNKTKSKLLLLEEDLKHLEDIKNGKKIECPKCGFTWINGYDKLKHEKLVNEQKKLKERYEKLDKEYKELEEIINILEEKKQLVMVYQNELFSLPTSFRDFLDIRDFENISNKLQTLLSIHNNSILLNEKLDEKIEIERKLNIIEKLSTSKLNQIFDRINEVRKQYSKTIEEINNYNKEYEQLKNIDNFIKDIKEKTNELKNLIKLNRKIKDNEIKKVKNEYINRLIYELKKLLNTLETELIEYNNSKQRYESLIKELKDYEERIKVVKVLVDLLSPNKGIIGRSIVKIINDVLEKMNDIINRVWTYEIKILPCNIDETDLTFRFPVLINNVKLISDVSKGSSSIKEIIDLAFKIVAMEYLNMLDYPLILDEFGRTMDETHRIKAYDLIEELSKKYFSQIYLVSHFESMYNRFTDVDVVVLNDENISIESDNTVVKIN